MSNCIEVMVIVEGKTEEIFETINAATREEVVRLYADQKAEKRFIPFITVHEFEALLFSNPESLSTRLRVELARVEKVLKECGEPEAINNDPVSAPSKRLDAWSKNGKFRKTTTGIAIARDIGIGKIREKCPLFHS